jgi:hypothetical protein
VLAAIYLDDEATLDTAKVNDIGPDRPLSLELEPAKPSIAQLKPHNSFSVGHLPTQSSCMRADWAHGAVCPHPTLSRKRERA